MKRVTGIGGVFFKSEDPEKTKNWYHQHLGIETDQYGGKFLWRDHDDHEKKCMTAWSPMPQTTDYYHPSSSEFMINYRVEDLSALLKLLKDEGVEQVGEVEEYDYGKFAWIIDPDGRKVELWEPVDTPLL